MENIKELKAWVYDRPVGKFESLRNGTFRFTYFKGVAKGHEVSLAMPVRKEPYFFHAFPAALGQHIPQGVVRYTIESIFSKIPNFKGLTDMDFLNMVGRNQCGRVSFTDMQTEALLLPKPFRIDREKVESSVNGEALFHSYMNKPRAMGEYCGVAGSVPKLLGQEGQRSDSSSKESTNDVNLAAHSPRTLVYHESILKSSNPMIPSLSVNESECLGAAKHCGFKVPSFTRSKDGMLLLIKRFDRKGVAKLGFEDFSSLASYKDSNLEDSQYHGTYAGVLKAGYHYCEQRGMTKDACTSIQLGLLKRIAFSNFMRDNDLHLKNIGLIYSSKELAVSPLYDVTCTDILRINNVRMHSKMALPWSIKDGDESWKSPDELVDFAKRNTSIPLPHIQKSIEGVFNGVRSWAIQCMESPENNVQSAIAQCVNDTTQFYINMGMTECMTKPVEEPTNAFSM